jgi:hypothetical protein
MALKPMSRQMMNRYRIDRCEEEMQCLISGIYYPVVDCARQSDKTVYHHRIPSDLEIYQKNMPEILKRLQVLFPDCQVSHALVSEGSDGILYDISKIEEKDLHKVVMVSENSYIVIDWT